MLHQPFYRLLPWTVCFAAVALVMSTMWLTLANRELLRILNPWEVVFGIVSVLAYATPGALIVSRRRGNRIGWLFLLVAILFALLNFSSTYAVYALRVLNRSLPGATFAAWLQSWLSLLIFSLLSVFLILFPDGLLPSRRWSIILGIQLFIFGSFSLFSATEDTWIAYYPLWSDQPIPLINHNPFAVPALVARLEPIQDLLWLFAIIGILISALAPILRYRSADRVARLQLRWLMFMTVIFLVALILNMVASDLGWLVSPYLNVLWTLTTLIGFPMAVSVAILRHNLYDIDLIIRRTLIFSALSATLALVYFGSVTVLQLVLPVRSELVTVASTLAIAALFNPLREQIQRTIDRRFYRRKYDAVTTLTDFGVITRDEIDMHDLAAEIFQVLYKTLQPETISLWLREK